MHPAQATAKGAALMEAILQVRIGTRAGRSRIATSCILIGSAFAY
jgi:hypothetical protein